jgi:hypothetical protein
MTGLTLQRAREGRIFPTRVRSCERLRVAFDEDMEAIRHRIEERHRHANAAHAAGTRVWIERAGRWLPGVVTAALDGDRYRVRFDGWLARGDDEVAKERVAPYDRPPPGPRGGRSELWLLLGFIMLLIVAMMASAIGEGAPATEPEGANRISSIHDVHVGQDVWVSTEDSWYPGTIDSIDTAHSTVRVQLDGTTDPSDENFPLHHVRTR